MSNILFTIFLSIIILGPVKDVHANDKLRVKILATGGTIAGVGNSRLGGAYLPGALSIDDVLKTFPEIYNLARISSEQIVSIASQDMNATIWLAISKRVNQIFSNDEADAVIITHGTDTQEETAYFLNLTVNSEKPVIVVGAMRAANAISSDGRKNLYDAVVLAVDRESRGKGVLVCMNEKVFEARDVTKVSSTDIETFQSPNFGPIGLIYDSKVQYYYKSLRRHKAKESLFNVRDLDSLPKVEIAYMYPGASDAAIQAFIKEGVKGIIIAGTGNGNLNKLNLEAVAIASSKGIKVVRSGRGMRGLVTLHNEVDDKKLGTIVSDDLNPVKARILLMLALTKTNDQTEIQHIFFSM